MDPAYLPVIVGVHRRSARSAGRRYERGGWRNRGLMDVVKLPPHREPVRSASGCWPPARLGWIDVAAGYPGTAGQAIADAFLFAPMAHHLGVSVVQQDAIRECRRWDALSRLSRDHCYIVRTPGTPVRQCVGRSCRHLPRSEAGFRWFWTIAPGRIRTCAHGSGGPCGLRESSWSTLHRC